MKEKEIYKVFKETIRSLWEISDQGNVKRNGVPYECRLNCGYKIFGSNYKVHRAVAMLFIPNPENKPCVDHINGNPLDNRATNLRWVTPKENSNNPITRKRNSESKKGKPRLEESKRKQSESMKGKNKGKVLGPQSEDHRRNISESMKGKTQSEETRRKRSESLKGKNNPMYGKSHTEKSKRKTSESMKRYWKNKKAQK